MDDNYDPRRIHADDDDDDDGRRMSHLSIESTDGDDADAELSDQDKAPKAVDDDDESDKDAPASLPGTPERRRAGRPIWVKEYASDAEAQKQSKGKGRRERLDRAWEMRRKCREAAEGKPDSECQWVLVQLRGRDSSMRMDMDEVKACRDLGLELPCDWTVEIPCDTSSGGNSPVANWMISSPGDDPKDVKARLKAWAQAVALASASRLGS